MKKYSFKTGGYYDDAIHGNQVPADSVSITDDEYKSLLNGQSAGKIVIKGPNGKPILADASPPTIEQLSSMARAKRDILLRNSDFSQLPDAPVNKVAWLEYRQSLRDIPEQAKFPQSVEWPSPPEA